MLTPRTPRPPFTPTRLATLVAAAALGALLAAAGGAEAQGNQPPLVSLINVVDDPPFAHYYVSAVDPEGGPLTYTWTLDPNEPGCNAKSFPEPWHMVWRHDGSGCSHTSTSHAGGIDVVVSDGVHEVRRWHMTGTFPGDDLRKDVDLTLTKTATRTDGSPAGAWEVGDVVRFAVTAANAGPSTATDVILRDFLPPGLHVVAFAPSGCAQDGGKVECVVPALPAGDAFTLSLDAEIAEAGTFTNVAAVMAGELDLAPGTNRATAAVTARAPCSAPAPDGSCPPPTPASLALTKTGSPPFIQLGGALSQGPATYVLTVTNSGGTAATNVRVVDTLPPKRGVVFTSVEALPGECLYAPATHRVHCTLAELGPGETWTIRIKAEVVAAGTWLNTARLYAGSSAAVLDIATATIVANLEPADLYVQKTRAGNGDAIVGNPVTYLVTVTNLGPGTAAGVRVQEFLPMGFLLDAAAPSQGLCVQGNTGLNCELGAISAGGVVTITVTGTPTTTQTQTNRAVGSTTSKDPNGGNNAATVTHPVHPRGPRIELEKIPVIPGDELRVHGRVTYLLRATNTGTDDATGVVLADALPRALGFVSAEGPPGSCLYFPATRKVRCALDVLPVGSTWQVTIVADALTAGTAVNKASVTHDGASGAVDIASATVRIHPPRADLQVTKTPVADRGLPVLQGAALGFVITVTNAGPDPATGVVLTDALPNAYTFRGVTPSAGCTVKGQNLRCDVGTLTAGESRTFTLDGLAALPGTMSNTAKVSAREADPVSTNNAALATAGVVPVGPDLRITKVSLAAGKVLVGERTAFRITVANVGNAPAEPAVMTDTLPPASAMPFGSVSDDRGADCVFAPVARVVCTLSSLGPGETWTIDVALDAVHHGTWTNRASVGGGGSAQAAVKVDARRADLSLSKATDPPTSAKVGERLTYTLEATHISGDPVLQASVRDVLPAGFDVERIEGPLCSLAGRTVTCNPGSMAPGDTAEITITGKFAEPGMFLNTARVSSEAKDPRPNNNVDSVSTNVLPLTADLEVTTSGPLFAGKGSTFYLQLRVRNLGPDEATFAELAVSAADLADGDFWASSDLGDCHRDWLYFYDCPLGSIPAGGEKTVTVKVLAPTNLPRLATYGRAAAIELDPRSSNNYAVGATILTDP